MMQLLYKSLMLGVVTILLNSCVREQGNGTTSIRELTGGDNAGNSTYLLTIYAPHGSVEKSPEKTIYNSGDIVRLTAHPLNGYIFSIWSGDTTGGDSIITITMNGNKTIIAGFAVSSHPPTITFTGGDTIVIAQNDRNFSNYKVTASDNQGGDLTNSIYKSCDVYTSICSTYVVTYSVSDNAGNTASKTRVIIVDCEGPVITLKGRVVDSVAVGKTYTDPGATAIDKISGAATVTPPPAPNTSVEAIDTLKYGAIDKVGNKSVKVRILVVYKPAIIDTIKPVITLIGGKDTAILVGSNWREPGYTASDNIDGAITSKVSVSGSVNTAVPNVYTLSYSVSDKAGNDAVPQTRMVTVKKSNVTADPVITLKGRNPDTAKVGAGNYIDPGYTAVSGTGADLTAAVKVTELYGKTLPISLAVSGGYTLVYKVSDNAGRQATVIRDVWVIGPSNDKTPPLIYLSGKNPDTVKLGSGKYIDPGFSATDNVDGTITNKVVRVYKNAAGMVVDSVQFTTSIGAHTITYSVSDKAGNAAMPQIRKVWVKDSATIPAQGLLDKYGLPLSAALPTINGVYKTTPAVDGTGGPIVSNITTFTIRWDLDLKMLMQFSFYTSDGKPNYYFNLTPAQTFAQASPGFTLTGTRITGLDGAYYIKADATQCVWVRTDGSFAIVFKP